MRRQVTTTALVALALAALAGAATRPGPQEQGPAEPADAWRQRALVDLRRVRLEQTLIRAERTAVMLGELFALRPAESGP